MVPRIFVSSTFYDLKFIREDLSNFIKAHDFEPIMFEDGDIGYTPGMPLDASCYDTMKSADMVILIIGGEYGSPATGEKKDEFKEYMSITRKEFRAAADAGIPIFVFIESSVYSEYGVYEVNLEKIEEKGMDIEFKATKSINVFRFIKEIRSLSDRPIQEFSRSGEIKSFLSKQWADMFKSYLVLLRQKQEGANLHNTVSDMESLIKQMSIMLDAVGRKVIGGDDKKQYNSILQQQNEVQSKRVSNLISGGISVVPRKGTSRSENVEMLIDVLKNISVSDMQKISDESEKESIIDSVASLIFDKFDERGYVLRRLMSSLVDALPDISESLKNKDIETLTINRLCAIPYYRKIFGGVSQEADMKNVTEE